MGIWLANMRGVELEDILDFKESVSLLLISTLFIVLAARLDLDQLAALGGGAVAERRSHVFGDPVLFRKDLETCQCLRFAQICIAPARDQLSGLGEKLDLANATASQFHVVSG